MFFCADFVGFNREKTVWVKLVMEGIHNKEPYFLKLTLVALEFSPTNFKPYYLIKTC